MFPSIGVGDIVPLPCETQPFWNPVPSDVDVNALPSAITLSGDPVVDASFGMPRIDFYSETGVIIGTAIAATVSPERNSLTFATPMFLQSQYSGSYGLVINNVGADGNLSPVAAAAIGIYGNDPPPPPPPDCDPITLECQPSDD